VNIKNIFFVPQPLYAIAVDVDITKKIYTLFVCKGLITSIEVNEDYKFILTVEGYNKKRGGYFEICYLSPDDVFEDKKEAQKRLIEMQKT